MQIKHLLESEVKHLSAEQLRVCVGYIDDRLQSLKGKRRELIAAQRERGIPTTKKEPR